MPDMTSNPIFAAIDQDGEKSSKNRHLQRYSPMVHIGFERSVMAAHQPFCTPKTLAIPSVTAL